MSYVTPQQLEDKRLLVDTLSDAIDQLEWAQDLIPSPRSIRLGQYPLRARPAGRRSQIAKQLVRPSVSTLTRNER